MWLYTSANTSGNLTKVGEPWTPWMVILALLVATHLVGGESCLPEYYWNQSFDCVPCSACGAGQGVTAPCGGYNDTQCEDCQDGHFSRQTLWGRECTPCQSCTPARTVVSPCTPTQDRICGTCSRGYFLHVDESGSECLLCSKCPTHRTALHWLECAEAGEHEDNQCAPGEWTVTGYHSSSPTSSSVQPTTTIRLAVKTRLPTDHGMFVPMASYSLKGDNLPAEDTTSMYIGIVSMIFTTATATAFISTTICYLISDRHSKKKRRARHPIQVEDSSMPIELGPEVSEL